MFVFLNFAILPYKTAKIQDFPGPAEPGGQGGQLPPQILTELAMKPVPSNNLVLLRAPSNFLTFLRP